MNINKSDLLAMVATMVFIFSIVYLSEKNKGTPPPVDKEIYIRHKRDSLEMEWYIRQLEHSYPFEHSKIPAQ